MINILHLSWGMEVGGKENFLNQLIRGLDQREFTATIMTLRQRGPYWRQLQEDGFDVRHLDKKPGIDPGAVRRLKNEIAAIAPDIIHAHEFSSTLAAQAAMSAADGARLITTLHGGHQKLNFAKRLVYGFLLRRCSAITAVAEHLVEDARAMTGEKVRVFHIPYGVDLKRFEKTINRREILAGLGLPADARVVVFVARLEPPKLPSLVINSAARVCREVPCCHYIMAGDGSLKESLQKTAAGLGLADKVHFTGTRMDIPELLAIADVCVLASRSEGLPLAVQEYMAAGKPVVATRTNGITEMVINGENGFLADIGDEKEFSEKTIFLLNRRDTAEAMGRRGRQRAEERFSISAMFKAYEDTYLMMAGEFKGSKAGR